MSAVVSTIRTRFDEPSAGATTRHRFRAGLQNEMLRQKRFLQRRMSCADTAEDLAQDAILQAYQGLGRFQARSSLSTWITGISANLRRQHLQRAPQHRFEHLDLDEQSLADDALEPSLQLELEQLTATIEAAVTRLSPELREAFMLVAVRGHSYQSVASLADTSVTNVKNRVHRARKALKQAVRESERPPRVPGHEHP